MAFRLFRRRRKRSAPKQKRKVSSESSSQQPARHTVYNRAKKPGFIRRQFTFSGMLRLAMICIIFGGLTIMYFARGLPDIHDLNTIKKQQGITIESADGRIVATYGDVYGAFVPYEKLPKSLIEAVVATEDRRFFVHHGIDIWGIIRAMGVNIMHGRIVQGGSTITQQVAKNIFLTPRRSLDRKIQEAILALWLEGRYSKQENLAIYLNRVYMGGGTFGIDAASRRYFNKSASDLTLPESALIAGLLKAPTKFSPVASVERSRGRVHQVLENMVDADMLDAKAIDPAMKQFDELQLHSVEGSNARYFSDWVVDQIPDYVGNMQEDIVVVTTFDPKLEEEAGDAIENAISMEGPAKKISQGAIVAMHPDGAVVAMIGGVNYGKSQYNRASQAKRQPGSSFKLFTYLAALEAGYTPMSTIEDAPVEMQVGNKVWTPDNYTGAFKGEVPMTQAFRESLNSAAVRLSQYAGIDRVAQMAMRLGVPNIPAYASIALGSVEATVLDMTGAYAHLANGGNKVVPYAILGIRTAKGEELYKRDEPAAEPVLASGTVHMMNYMLLDVVRAGTGTRARLPGREVAGKTGTSQDYKDAWFIGFTPQLVTGVWVGNDDNSPMAKVTGGSVPASIWHDFMIKAMEGVKAAPIPNDDASSEGLLPWLFGGSSDENQQAAPMNGSAPVDMPTHNVPVEQPMSAPHVQQNDSILTPGFWDKLMKKVPSVPNKGKLEYHYPDSNKRN